MRIERVVVRSSLSDDIRQVGDAPSIYWLGQAGFLVAAGGRRILIDPYLSDHLADKYRGKRFAHERMMPAPIDAAGFDRLDWILCTHRHGDHMDPPFLADAAARHPTARILVPAAERAYAESLGLPSDRLTGIDAGERIAIADGRVEALPAAHETFDRDELGRHRYLGYVLAVGNVRIYHSGDTVPFVGLPPLIRAARPDLALLPVNGRDEERRRNGVPGNMTLADAVDICRDCGIPALVPHHFGMFAFNTIDADEIDRAAACVRDVAIFRPDPATRFVLHPD